MAVNSFNPRLGYGFSSSSSENDVEEVFIKPGAAGALPSMTVLSRSRCISDPIYDIANKNDLKGRTPALSDSSNVVKRIGGNVIPLNSKNSAETKVECSTISEGFIQTTLRGNSCTSERSLSENAFPEPESMRQRIQDTNTFSLEDDDGNMTGRHLSITLADLDLETVDQNSTMFMTDVVFEARNAHHTSVGADGDHDELEEDVDDDDSYPEIERFPSGYGNLLYEDFPITSVFSPDTTRIVVPSFDADSFPEVPENLMNDSGTYFTEYEFDLSSADIPSPIQPNCHLSKGLIEGDW